MDEPVRLSEMDWALLIELLQREQRELPVEIHHCRVARVSEQLRQRLDHVHQLLERLHPVTAS